MEGRKDTVCVTGGAGFMASWLIMRLLKHGYSVRATVRSDPKYKEDASHLLSLPEAPEKLQIFDAELENPESYEEVIKGCVGVFHLSHPMDFKGEIPRETVIKTAIEGTLGLLRACVKSKTVKRVVYTSSNSATLLVGTTEDNRQIDENVWTDVDVIRHIDIPEVSYIVAKTLTERAALQFSKEHGLDVVTILPSAIIGPFISLALPCSFHQTLPLIFGDEQHCMYMNTAHYVHIDDVASAQIFLLECPKSEGRHICSSTDVTLHEIAKLLSMKCPEHLIPTDFLNKIKEGKPDHYTSKKLQDLGFKFKYGVEEMIDGALQSCKEKGFL